MNNDKKTKKQLIEELELEKGRSDALYQVSSQLAGAHDTDEVLDLIVNESTRLVGATAAIIRLVEGHVLVPSAATDSAAAYLAAHKEIHPPTSMEAGASMLSTIMASGKPYVSEDFTDEIAMPDIREIFREQGFHAIAGIPLLANGQLVGSLTVFDLRIRRFTDDEVSLLTAFADQAALALEKARLLNEAETERGRAETERERSDALYKVSNLLAGTHDTDEVLNLIVNEAARLVATPAAVIRLLEGDILVIGAATETAAAYAAESARLMPSLPMGEGNAAGRILGGKQPRTHPDASQNEELFPETRALLQKYEFHGLVTIPLVANDRSIGTLSLWDQQIRQYTEDEVSLLTAFADQAALALEKARLLNEAEREKERSDALYRVSNLLAGAYDTGEALNLIVNEAARLVGAAGSYMRLIENNTLVAAAVTDSVSDFVAGLVPNISIEEGKRSLSGHAMATRKL